MMAELPRKRLQVFTLRKDAPKHKRLLEPQPANENSIALDRILTNRTLRSKLLSIYSATFDTKPIANKIRCALAVDEFDKITEKTERKQKGRKIVAMFVHAGSMFNVFDVPQDLYRALLDDQERFFYFDDLRLHCKEMLCANEDVMREVHSLLFSG